MTGESEFNAHARCQWCNALRPVKETVTLNSHTVCRDGDCLKHMKGHYNASGLSGYAPALRGSGNGD